MGLGDGRENLGVWIRIRVPSRTSCDLILVISPFWALHRVSKWDEILSSILYDILILCLKSRGVHARGGRAGGATRFKNSSAIQFLQSLASFPTAGTQAPGLRASEEALQSPPELGVRSRHTSGRPPQSSTPTAVTGRPPRLGRSEVLLPSISAGGWAGRRLSCWRSPKASLYAAPGTSPTACWAPRQRPQQQHRLTGRPPPPPSYSEYASVG